MPLTPPPAALTIVKPEARVLPPAEWAEKLAGTPLEGMPLDPAFAVVVVVEMSGKVVAQWTAQNVVHVEGLWIDETCRGHAGVARALLQTMVERLQAGGVVEVMTSTDAPSVVGMVTKMGGRQMPGDLYVIPVAAITTEPT